MYRQGDILIVPFEQNKSQRRTELYDSIGTEDNMTIESKTNIIAEGEVTGHHHRINENGTVLLDKESQPTFVVAQEDCKLTHEEHDTINIAPGLYFIVNQREYAGQQRVRRVLD